MYIYLLLLSLLLLLYVVYGYSMCWRPSENLESDTDLFMAGYLLLSQFMAHIWMTGAVWGTCFSR